MALNLIKPFISEILQQVRLHGILSDGKTNYFSVPQHTVPTYSYFIYIIYVYSPEMFCYAYFLWHSNSVQKS